MGLNIGWLDYDDKKSSVVHLLNDVLQRSGLSMPAKPPEEPLKDPFERFYNSRAYPFREFAEFCRAGKLPYPHVLKLTLSRWQMIVPIDFPDPIPMFLDKRPEDYDEDWEWETEEEYLARLNPEELAYHNKYPDTYPYYSYTPPSEVYLLSARRLVAETVAFLDAFVPGFTGPGFNRHGDNLHPNAWDAAMLHDKCLSAIRTNSVLGFG